MTTLTYWGLVWRRFRRNRMGLYGSIGAAIVTAVAVAAPLIASDKPLLRQDGNAVWSPWAVSLLDFGCYPSAVDRFLNCFLIVGLIFLALLPTIIFARVLLLPAVRGFWPTLGLVYLTCALTLTATVSVAQFHYERPTAFYAPIASPAPIGTAPTTSGDLGTFDPPTAGTLAQMPAPIAFSPTPPLSVDPADANLPAMSVDSHGRFRLVGTTAQGADVAAILVHGARTTLIVAVAGVGIAVVVGFLIGLLAGLFDGVPELVVTWLTDSFAVVPALLFGMALLAMIPYRAPSVVWGVAVIACVAWVPIARLVRREVRRERRRDHIAAVRAIGGSWSHIVTHHLLPAGVGPAIVTSCFGIALAVGLEITLAFFRLAPSPYSWGELLRQGHELPGRPWLLILPAVAAFATILVFNMIGEALHVAYREVQSKSADDRT